MTPGLFSWQQEPKLLLPFNYQALEYPTLIHIVDSNDLDHFKANLADNHFNFVTWKHKYMYNHTHFEFCTLQMNNSNYNDCSIRVHCDDCFLQNPPTVEELYYYMFR